MNELSQEVQEEVSSNPDSSSVEESTLQGGSFDSGDSPTCRDSDMAEANSRKRFLSTSSSSDSGTEYDSKSSPCSDVDTSGKQPSACQHRKRKNLAVCVERSRSRTRSVSRDESQGNAGSVELFTGSASILDD